MKEYIPDFEALMENIIRSVIAMENMQNINLSNRHVRTIGKTAEWLRSIDEGTPICYSTIRNAVIDGKVPCVKIGNKRLVVIEEVYRYFYGVDIDPAKVTL